MGLLGIIFMGIAMMPLFAWIAKLIKKPAGVGALIGFFMGFAVAIFLNEMASSLYVGNGNEEFTSYFVYGTPEYELSNGDKIKVEIGTGELMVINDSKGVLVLEEAKYGSIFKGGTKWVKHGKSRIIEGSKVHYFFDD